MAKYILDPRVLPALIASIEQDIESDFFTGQFRSQAVSLVKKLKQTDKPDLDREEYEWLRIYISGLLCEDLDSIEDYPENSPEVEDYQVVEDTGDDSLTQGEEPRRLSKEELEVRPGESTREFISRLAKKYDIES